MTDREKLIALMLQGDVEDEVSETTTQHREYIADLMIANGVVIRERGEWGYTGVEDEDWGATWHKWTCSNCGYSTGQNPFGENFCPNCGADMRKR